ncbi:hypothetical protein ACHAXT_003442 [Thalassiosira profunda]
MVNLTRLLVLSPLLLAAATASTGVDGLTDQCAVPGACTGETRRRTATRLREQMEARLAELESANPNGSDEVEVERLRQQLNARLANAGAKPKPNVGSSGRTPQNNNPKNNPEDGYDIEGVDAETLQYWNGLEIYEVPEMHAALSEIAGVPGLTTPMQRHVERTLVAHHHPEGKKTPTYANFGSLLDVSTVYSASWGGSTEFGGKVSWIASIFYRKDIVEHEGGTPCRGEDETCHVGVRIEDYVSVRGTEEKLHEHMELAAYWDVLDEGQWRTGTVLELGFDRKFDTILASGSLTGEDDEALRIMTKLKSLLNPGGVVFFVGTEPPTAVEGPEGTYTQMLEVIDSAKELAGEIPTRNVPAAWINKSLVGLGLDVFSSVRFPVKPTYDDMSETVEEALTWMDEADSQALTASIQNRYKQELNQMLNRLSEVARDGPIFAGEYQYIIAAELPEDGGTRGDVVVESTIYQPKE